MWPDSRREGDREYYLNVMVGRRDDGTVIYSSDLLAERSAARQEGARQERQLLDDARMYLESARRMLADTDINGTPWWDGLTRMIAAIRSGEPREEPR